MAPVFCISRGYEHLVIAGLLAGWCHVCSTLKYGHIMCIAARQVPACLDSPVSAPASGCFLLSAAGTSTYGSTKPECHTAAKQGHHSAKLAAADSILSKALWAAAMVCAFW